MSSPCTHKEMEIIEIGIAEAQKDIMRCKKCLKVMGIVWIKPKQETGVLASPVKPSHGPNSVRSDIVVQSARQLFL